MPSSIGANIDNLSSAPDSPASAGEARDARGTSARRNAAARWLHYGSLVAGFITLMWLGRNHWFVNDEWEFITNRGLVGAQLGLFAPHTQHWSTGPILVYRALLNISGLHSYVPFLLVNVLSYLIAIHLGWRVAVRAGAAVPVATGLALLVMVSAGSGDTAFYAFQISFTASVAFGLALLLLVDRQEPMGPRLRTAVTLFAVASLTFSSISVVLVVTAAMLAWLRHGWRTSAVLFGPPAAIFATWYVLAGRSTIAEGTGKLELTWPTVRHAPVFVIDGLAAALARPILVETGALLVLGVVTVGAAIATRRHWRVDAALALAAALGAVAFLTLTAVGRGAVTPSQSRYLFVTATLLLPVVALAVTALWRRGVAVQIVVVMVLLIVATFNVRDLRRTALAQDATDLAVREHVLASATLIRQGLAMPAGLLPDADLAPDLDIAKLRTLIRSGWVPTTRVDPRALKRAGQFTDVVVSSQPGPAASMATISPHWGAGVGPGCSLVNPVGGPTSVRLRSTGSSVIEVRTDKPTHLKFWHLSEGRVNGPEVDVPISSGARTYLHFRRLLDDRVVAAWPVPVSLCPEPRH